MKKWVKILLWVVGVIVALLALVSLLGGPIAKGYVNRHGEQLTGRTVHVDHVGLNLFTGHVNIRGLNMYEDDGEAVFASFDTLDVKAHLLKLPFKTLYMKHIALSGLKAQILQEGERFNFNSLIEHFASDEEEKDTTPSNWTLKFYNVRLSHARVAYRDVASQKQWLLPDINMRVPGFVLGGKEESTGGLSIGFDDGGRLNIGASYDAHSSSFELNAHLTDFALENIEELLSDAIRTEGIDGTAEANITVKGSVSELLRSRIGGNVTLNGVALQCNDQKVATLKTLGVKVNNINLEANNYDISSVHLDGLEASYENWADHNTLSNLIVKKEAETPDSSDNVEHSAKTEKAKPLRFTVGQLTVSNCSLTYDDHTLPDPLHLPVTGISITASNINTAGENNARLRASLPGGGKLTVIWNGAIDNWKQHQDLVLSVKGLDMKQLSPWVVAYTGQPIEDGVFGLSSHNTIVNSNIEGENSIDIYKAKVGHRRKDVTPEQKLPLRTALYILKDKDDKIQLDVPVKGNVDSPEFNYMKAVWKTLGNLLVKVATSPVRAVGNALGFSDDELDFIAVDPTQHSLTSEQYHTLGKLAEAAQYDTSIVLTLERHLPADSTGRYEIIDKMIQEYLTDQGVSQRRIHMNEGKATDEKGRHGYTIGSKTKLIDE